MTGAKEKIERALGERLGLKGERCASPKCAAVRKPYKPGMHGNSKGRRSQLSEFGRQIREKRKFKVSYGIDERNLRNLFELAEKSKGSTADRLIELFERRLDNVVFRLGVAPSRGAARQLVVHGHITVNQKKVHSPNFLVRAGDIIGISPGSETTTAITKRKEYLAKVEPPAWLHLDPGKVEGKVLALPQNEPAPFDINLLVESFNK